MKKFILFPCLLLASSITVPVNQAYGFPPFLKFWGSKESRKPLIQEHFVAPTTLKIQAPQKTHHLSMGLSAISRKNEGGVKSPWNRLSTMHLNLFKNNDRSESHLTLTIFNTDETPGSSQGSSFTYGTDWSTDTYDLGYGQLKDSTSSWNLWETSNHPHKNKRKEIDDIFEEIQNQKEEASLTVQSDIPAPTFNKTLQFWKNLEIEVKEE